MRRNHIGSVTNHGQPWRTGPPELNRTLSLQFRSHGRWAKFRRYFVPMARIFPAFGSKPNGAAQCSLQPPRVLSQFAIELSSKHRWFLRQSHRGPTRGCCHGIREPGQRRGLRLCPRGRFHPDRTMSPSKRVSDLSSGFSQETQLSQNG